jgi:hypothetical protein
MGDCGFISVLMAFADENQFGTGNREDRNAAPLPSDSLDDEMEELETDSSGDEAAEDYQIEKATAADWKEEFPDYTEEEFEEKIPNRTRSRWMAPVVSCLLGTLLGAAIAGLLVNDQPKPQQARAFFIFFLVFALLFSCLWHWLFYVRPKNLAKKMKEQEANPIGSEPILSNEELQRANPVGSEPIHPK